MNQSLRTRETMDCPSCTNRPTARRPRRWTVPLHELVDVTIATETVAVEIVVEADVVQAVTETMDCQPSRHDRLPAHVLPCKSDLWT
jgi:hypothetical protein